MTQSRFCSPAVFLSLAALLCIATPVWHLAAQEVGEPISDSEIEKLIQQLGSKSYPAREAAQKKLSKLVEAAPALHNALKSPDKEIVSRAGKILEALAEPLAKQWAAKVAALAEQGEVDSVVEQLVYNWHGRQKEAAWAAVGKIACRVLDWREETFPLKELHQIHFAGYQPKDFEAFVKHACLRDTWFQKCVLAPTPEDKSGPLFVRAESIAVMKSLSCGVLISAGPIKSVPAGLVNLVNRNLVLSNDSVAAFGKASIIICDGEFQSEGKYLSESLVIAREGVCLTCNASKCVILSGGPVRMTANKGYVDRSMIISSGPVQIPKDAVDYSNVIKENQPATFGPIQFFEPARVGIEVESSKEQIQVKKLDPAKMFAKAGLQAGDVLLSLDKNPVKSPASFRKQLRHSLVVQTYLLFEVHRGDKTVAISVPNK